MHTPVLSILIPAYEYSFGVKRILDSVYESITIDPEICLECIVSDDSVSDQVKIMVKAHKIFEHSSFRYYKRTKSLGAADNWNFLLNEASGRYLQFFHHDEFPERKNFFGILISELQENSEPDVLFLRCYVSTIIRDRFRPLVNSFVRNLYFLSHEGLFLRNTVGSPTSAVVKREKCLLFDVRLQWLVDLEWFYRILNQKDIVISFSNLSYISVHRKESISSQIKSNIKTINSEERILIKQNYLPKFVNEYQDSSNLWYKIFMFMESIFWLSSKLLYYPIGLIFGKRVNPMFFERMENDRK